MYVQNYVPEPEQMPGNVTKVPYSLRLKFIRQSLFRFIGSIGMVVGVGLVVPRNLELVPITVAFLVVLFCVSGIRTLFRGTPIEARLTTLALPFVVVMTAMAARCFITAQFPVWAILPGIACFGIYAAVCGRDFSFVGGYTLSLITSSVLIACVMVEEGMSSNRSAQALLWNAGGLFYLVYDLAALLSRRLPSESWAAVVDLYRDVFNFIGYFPRVLMHWNRYRILNDLNFENPFRNEPSR